MKDIDVTFEVAGEDAQVKNIKLQKAIYYGEASEEKAQFVCEQIGTLDYKLYISAVNGEPCDTGYALTGNILSLESGFKRNLVFEEGTGTWCGWCVVGYAGMEYMKETYGDKGFIGIAVHRMTQWPLSTGVAHMLHSASISTASRLHSSTATGAQTFIRTLTFSKRNMKL